MLFHLDVLVWLLHAAGLDGVLCILDYGSGVSSQKDGMEKEEGW